MKSKQRLGRATKTTQPRASSYDTSMTRLDARATVIRSKLIGTQPSTIHARHLDGLCVFFFNFRLTISEIDTTLDSPKQKASPPRRWVPLKQAGTRLPIPLDSDHFFAPTRQERLLF
jgi:hypothetical protein